MSSVCLEGVSDAESEIAGRPMTVRSGPPVLVVDDSPVDRRWAGRMVERRCGLRVEYASTGLEALEAVDRDTPSAVLTDLQMPEMDGLALVQALRERYPLVPVILMTAHGSEEIALKALQSGAASYVPKKSLPLDLAGTMAQVLASAKAAHHRRRVRECASQLDLRFVLRSDPTLVGELVAELRETPTHLQACDANEAIRVDVALHEALLNGIYHGNLEVSSELRQGGEAPFLRLANERREQSPYRERRLHVQARFTESEAVYTIRDEGPGFDVQNLPDPTDPENLFLASGRGLLLIRTFMDEVHFNEQGNQITMVKRPRA